MRSRIAPAARRLTAALALLAASTLACTGAPPASPAAPASRTGTSTDGAGLTAAVGPDGRLRAPTPDEARALSLQSGPGARAAADRPLQAVVLANGALAVALDDRFESTVLAGRAADGTGTVCLGSAAEAGAAPVAPAGAEDR